MTNMPSPSDLAAMAEAAPGHAVLRRRNDQVDFPCDPDFTPRLHQCDWLQSCPEGGLSARGARHGGGRADFSYAVFDALADPIAVLDGIGTVLAVNAAWQRFMAAQDCTVGGQVGGDYLEAMAAGMDQEDVRQARAGLGEVLGGRQASYSLAYCRGEQPPRRWWRMRVTPVARGWPGALVTLADISAERGSAEQLRIAAIAFESTEGMLVTDARGAILRVNQAFTNITGYTLDEVRGQTAARLKSGRHGPEFYQAMWLALREYGHWEGEIWNRRKNGELYPERLSISAVRDERLTTTHYVASLSDISLSKAASDEIKSLAFYDPLTQLPNRRLLLDRLKQALLMLARSHSINALMFIDLDNFKTLNDTLGHNIGDLLLQQVARRLQSCLRESDTVARLGGDEFVVLLEGLHDAALGAAAQAEHVAHKILDCLNQSYELAQHTCRSTPSIGITLFADQRQLPDELLMQADIAMYQAKKAGRNALRFFDQQMQDSISARASMEEQLRQALELEQFHLYYQVQVDQHGRAWGAEALIRWERPGVGFVSPGQFIPLAEETGLIIGIGDWVLQQACAQLHEWQKDPRTSELVLAINVSAKQFRQAGFGARLQQTLVRYAVPAGVLKLELTESILVENIEETIATMKRLKSLGIKFSLDDFGTGYSSLQYLKRLPLDQLKIDQSFVRDLATDSNDQAIVSTITGMACSLNLDVIAEGVETETQRQRLAAAGCLHYQGYLFGKPLPLEQFEQLLWRCGVTPVRHSD